MNSLTLSSLLRPSLPCRRALILNLSTRPYSDDMASDLPTFRKKIGRPKASMPEQPAKKFMPRNMKPKAKKIKEPLLEITGWDLPPIDRWREYFPIHGVVKQRVSVRNPDTAQLLAEALVPEGSRNKIIVDALPGPGQLTRALLKLPKERIKKIIVMEPGEAFRPYLTALEELDPRVKVFPWHGKDWDSYTKLSESGELDGVKVAKWDQVHPQLQFIMHMHWSVEGEQLLSQLLRCVPDRHWLFQYGRVPLNFIVPLKLWERVCAKESSSARGKLAVVAQGTMDIKNTVDPRKLQPYDEHWHPKRMYTQVDAKSNRANVPHAALTLTPLRTMPIQQGDMDVWDYCIRKLFVQKATSLERSLAANCLGPGSANLLPKLKDPSRPKKETINLKASPRDLSMREWKILVDEFKQWPFRPEDLGINTFFEVHTNNR